MLHQIVTCAMPRPHKFQARLLHALCRGLYPLSLPQEYPTSRAGTVQHLSARLVSLRRSTSTAVL